MDKRKEDYLVVRRAMMHFRYIIADFNKHFCYPGLSGNETFLICLIGTKPGIIAKEISYIMYLDMGYVSRSLHKLEDKKLVAWTAANKSHYTKQLHLTPEGEKIFTACERIDAEYTEQRLSRLEANERKNYIRNMKALLAILPRLTQDLLPPDEPEKR
jgi:DNA-binding MarR family transcriptional regulator